MCDPVSLALVAGGLSVAGGVSEMITGQQSAVAANKAAKQAVTQEQDSLRVNRAKLVRDQEIAKGKSIAAAGVSGASLNSFDTVMEDQQQSMLVDQALLEYDSKVRQEQLRFQGKTAAAQYRRQGWASLFKGVGSAAMMYGAASAAGSAASAAKPLETTVYGDGTIINWN